jgi:hypothetical protein
MHPPGSSGSHPWLDLPKAISEDEMNRSNAGIVSQNRASRGHPIPGSILSYVVGHTERHVYMIVVTIGDPRDPELFLISCSGSTYVIRETWGDRLEVGG